MKNKRILLMGHTDGFGGSQTAFWQLHKFIKAENYQVKVIALTNKKIRELPFGKKEIIGRVAYQKSAIPLAVRKIYDIIKISVQLHRYSPDIFISVGLNNSANLVSRLLKKRCFIVGQDYIADRKADDPLWHKSRTLLDGIAVQAPAMLLHWKQVDNKLVGLNWLPCFPDLPVDGIVRLNRNANLPVNAAVRLVYMGRLADNKGLPLIIQALAQPGVAANVTLNIWGTGSEETQLRQLVGELKLEKRVGFLGAYPAAEAGAKLMASYDALVLCSTRSEGLPLILLESMAYGLPFLVTNIGAISDCCVGNADAILVEPNQHDINAGLMNLITKIGDNYFDSQRLRKFYEANFSHSVMAARWQKFLQNPRLFFYENQ